MIRFKINLINIFLIAYLLLFSPGLIKAEEDFPAKDIYEKQSPSVVLILATEKGTGSIGAGSIITNDGLIITNAHVVINKEKEAPFQNISVFLKPEKLTGNIRKDLINPVRGEIVEFSREFDLALIKTDKPISKTLMGIADSSEIKQGEAVMAIGHPEQGGVWSLTVGRISGWIENYENITGKDVFQTDTSINRGNSGGPLLDKWGNMIAVNSNIARLSKDGLPITGVNFAIKSSVVKKWIESKGIQVAEAPSISEPEKQAEMTEQKKEVAEKESPVKQEKQAEVPEEKKEIVEKKISDRPEKPSEKKEDKLIIAEDKDLKKRPYTFDEVFKAVEEEMEGMIGEMKERIKQGK